MEQRTTTKVIFSKRIMIRLLEMGFRPIDTFPNPTNPQFMCWAFEWTDEFDAALCQVLSVAGQKGGAS